MMKASTFLFFALLATLVPATALAGASEWFLTDGARMRLVAAVSPDGKTVDAGLEFELEDGWKTYWRSPGGSGLPPQVHFLGSENVKSAIMELPVPKAYYDYGSEAIGYKNHVVFPITVTPKTPGQPFTLKAGGVVGVCGEICVPVQFELALKETGAAGTQMDVASALLKAKQGLPGPAHDEQKVLTAKLVGTTPERVTITARVPKGVTALDLFVEGPPQWYLTTAKLKDHNGDTATFELTLHDAPKDANLADTELRFTLVADGKGTDQRMAISSPQ